MNGTLLDGPGLEHTDDPAVLVPGSLAALYADADDLIRQAGELTGLAGEVRRRTVETWFGAGAERWAELRPVLADAIEAAAWAYEIAAVAVRAHAGVLVRGRAVAMIAVLLWEQAEVEEGRSLTVGLACVPPLPRLGVAQGLPSPGAVRLGGVGPGAAPSPLAVRADPTGLRALAGTVLARARDDVGQHAAEVATVLDQLCEGMPDGEFRLGDVVAGLGDWIAEMDRAWARWHPIRLVVDHEGVLADADRTLDALELTVSTLAENPHEANRLLLDAQLWHDEPGRWVGRMTPDALLTIAPGVGPASRGASTLAAALRALKDLRDVPPVPRVWTSKDPLVGELATWLSAQHPDLVRGVNAWLPTYHGKLHEVDIDLGEIVVEVKTGPARKAGPQLEVIANNTGRRPILFAPDIPTPARMTVLSKGFAVARTNEELLDIIKELL